MKLERKREVIELVRRSPGTKKETLRELGLSASTFYRWQQRYRSKGEAGLVDRRPQAGTIWNRLRPEEEQTILRAALREPDHSPREIACWISDEAGFSISESSVYRVLKRHGLAREVKWESVAAGQEYRHKTKRVNEQWQSDASYFFRGGLGLVLPDFGVGRLLADDPGVGAEDGQDLGIDQRSGGAGGGVYGDEERARGGSHAAGER